MYDERSPMSGLEPEMPARLDLIMFIMDFMPFQLKVLILPRKSLVKIHYVCCAFNGGKSILANLRYLILKIFWGTMPPDP